MFVRCKLQTEKQIIHEALFDANVTTAFLAACMEGTAITRGGSMIEHISRLTNVTAVYEMEDKKRDVTAFEVDRHVAESIKKN
ncbi:hypothetical protein O3P69_002259 [Scylla paramamosain]|uniref:Uncharacterized protein n=1 Tax=Scylla paramamosain TaxID=85552 RepID=A0AAW0V7B6_SCYPA